MSDYIDNAELKAKEDEFFKTHIKVAEGATINESIQSCIDWAKNVFEDVYKMGWNDCLNNKK